MNNDNTNLPIYLLGQTPLSIYLFGKLSAIGETPIIITPPSAKNKTSYDITIKEEYNLKKNKIAYKTDSYTFNKAKLLIITSEINKLKPELLLISPQNLSSTPCLIFSEEQNIDIAQSIIGKPLVRAWFNGWLTQEDNIINLYGNEPEILLHKDYNNIEDCLTALSILNRTNIKTSSIEDSNQVHWEHFSIRFLGSIITAKEQQNLYQICKNKEKRKNINKLTEELCSLAACNGANLSSEAITKQLYSVPPHYIFATQKLDSPAISTLNHYYHGLINRISGSKLQLPHLNGLMKEIYLRINPF